MKTKLAVWFTQKKFAESVPQAEEFLAAIKENECPQELLDILQKNLDVRIAIGGTITKETALSFLQEKLKTAENLIAFWEANPKDTNAIFFFREYHRYMEENQA
ncbi:MAG: hypothetical protein IJT01_11585 [Selenomonadaceae bacterium]|nr:hypothetical protein [Selenomonadaceae bacterium]